jgi:hypothetical protein
MKLRAVTASAFALAFALSACGGGHPSARPARARTAPTSTASAKTAPPTEAPTTQAPTTSTTAARAPVTPPRPSAPSTTATTSTPASFPPVVNDAMEALEPRPPGLEAPATLPAVAGAISAETSGLGGTYSVTLIATEKPEPVNSPQLAAAAANPASDLGTFSTTRAASLAAATTYLRASSSQYISACAAPADHVQLGGTTARGCPTAQGDALTWAEGPWEIQVSLVGGSRPPTATALALAAWLKSHSLPETSEGVVSVSVPGTPEAGTTTSSVVTWQAGEDVYQVSAPGGELRALELAASMAPWPSG